MLDFSTYNLLFALLSFAIIISLFSIVFAKNNLICIFAFSSFSVLICIVYLILDAPDVSMTEAAIGACLSTASLVIFTTKISESEKQFYFSVNTIFAVISCICVIILFSLLQGILPKVGEISNAINLGVAHSYIENTMKEIGIPEFVAAILASYRGLDTLCETVVILIAAVALYGILGLKDEKK